MDSDLKYQKESCNGSIIEELKTLIGAHRDEVSMFSEKIAPLDPDWDMYLMLEEKKALFTYTARNNGKLVGYYISFIVNHIHYKQTKVADCDIMYIMPEHRKGFAGFKLVRGAEKELEEIGGQYNYCFGKNT